MKIQTEKMSQAADGAVGLLQSLGNKSRLMIMCQLIDGEKSVGQLAELLQTRELTISQHLALLRKDRLVTTRREAQTIYYAIASDPARRVLETLYKIYCPQPLAPRPGALPLLPFAFAEDLVKQRDDAFDVIVCNTVVDGLPLSSRCHKTVEPQAAELLRHGRLAQRQGVFELRDRALFLGKKTEKEQPRLMGEGF